MSLYRASRLWRFRRWLKRNHVILPPPSKDCQRNGPECAGAYRASPYRGL